VRRERKKGVEKNEARGKATWWGDEEKNRREGKSDVVGR
jgi:hypothetical protein